MEKIMPFSTGEPLPDFAPGVQMRVFASSKCGATAFSTCLSTFAPAASLPYQLHPCSLALTIVEGAAMLHVEGRAYQLSIRDCAHIPTNVAYSMGNHSTDRELIVHSAIASPQPRFQLTDRQFPPDVSGHGDPAEGDPETIIRFANSPVYELSRHAYFTDLFARRMGSVGICGGYGRFLPGASLPCHTHEYDESITIVQGAATCLVEGRQYEMASTGTAYVPKGLRHRFVNTSSEEMAMIWVYAGDEPDRTIVDNTLCSQIIG